MATNPQYAATPNIEITQISTANTNRDGTGTFGTVSTGPSSAAGSGVGKRISRVVVCATVTTTAGAVRFFLSTDGGTTKRLIVEKLIPANTPSTTNTVVRFEVPELVGLVLQGTVSSSACNLYAATHAGEAINVIVESASL